MENPIFSPENRKFITPQEELEFLREKVAKQEQVGRATSTSFVPQLPPLILFCPPSL